MIEARSEFIKFCGNRCLCPFLTVYFIRSNYFANFLEFGNGFLGIICKSGKNFRSFLVQEHKLYCIAFLLSVGLKPNKLYFYFTKLNDTDISRTINVHVQVLISRYPICHLLMHDKKYNYQCSTEN